MIRVFSSSRRSRAVRGFTLTELIVSSAATALLVGGISSAVLMAMQALPSNQDDYYSALSAGAVAEQLTSELACATQILGLSDRGVAFNVPDRNGDGAPESIRYVWSGEAGDSLRRSYNGGASEDVLDNVTEFAVELDMMTVTLKPEPGPDDVVQGELKNFWQASYLGYLDVQEWFWTGQYFVPDLPSGATGYRVTNVTFVAIGSDNGMCLARLYRADAGGRPTGEPLATKPFHAREIPDDTISWVDVSFSGMPYLDPGQGVCFVLEHRAGSPACSVISAYWGNTDPALARIDSYDRGGSWYVSSEKSLIFLATGDIRRSDAGDEEEISVANAARVTLQAGDGGLFQTAVGLLNQPEVNP